MTYFRFGRGSLTSFEPASALQDNSLVAKVATDSDNPFRNPEVTLVLSN